MDFSSKSRTLQNLIGKLSSASIAPLHIFTVKEWREDFSRCIHNLHDLIGPSPWIVRSSSILEDCALHSNAGAFRSILDVEVSDLKNAVEDVIDSYSDAADNDEILIQPMLSNVVLSGVAFSHDPNTYSPYRMVNWADGGNTTEVTSGLSGRMWQQAAESPIPIPLQLKPVLLLINELLSLFNNQPIDCEFAITNKGSEKVLWLLQVRPLILSKKPQSVQEQSSLLDKISQRVASGIRPAPFLLGRKTVYGVMPDWNPAEIIGIRPKPLALSLYRELITDSIWAYQRNNYGYRNLRSFPLMPHFFGLPYIDARVSFNSFIPADLEDTIGEKLVNHYVDKLTDQPSLHDKIEFDIVYSCYTFDLPQRLESLLHLGFSNKDLGKIRNSLLRLTNEVINPLKSIWKIDSAKINKLYQRREELIQAGSDEISRIYWLLEDTKRYGTLPFAGLARAGFIAVQMLKSLVSLGSLSENDFDYFMSSVSTVSKKITRDRYLLDTSSFLVEYGHLRPGTYEITSPRYDEAPELYFDWDNKPALPSPKASYELTRSQIDNISNLLVSHKIQSSPQELFNFFREAIEQREYSKFQFTRNLSDILSLIEVFGIRYGFSREDLSYCDINDFKEIYTAATNAEDILKHSIRQGKLRHRQTLSISLPPLITQPDDVWAFEFPETEPNYITQKQITAGVTTHDNRESLGNKIVCIPNADPGFDWLFSYPIVGLITAWGGANSHMAIRAGELGLPAVIGSGEVLYRRWSQAHCLSLDCAGRRVDIIK